MMMDDDDDDDDVDDVDDDDDDVGNGGGDVSRFVLTATRLTGVDVKVEGEKHKITVSLCAEFTFDSHNIHRYALGSCFVLAFFKVFWWFSCFFFCWVNEIPIS